MISCFSSVTNPDKELKETFDVRSLSVVGAIEKLINTFYPTHFLKIRSLRKAFLVIFVCFFLSGTNFLEAKNPSPGSNRSLNSNGNILTSQNLYSDSSSQNSPIKNEGNPTFTVLNINHQPSYSKLTQNFLRVSSETTPINALLVPGLEVAFVDGPVYVNHIRETVWRRIQDREGFLNGDALKTENFGWIVVCFNNLGLVLVRPKSTLSFSYSQAPSIGLKIKLLSGSMLLSGENGNQIEVEGRNLNFNFVGGEASFYCDGKSDLLKSLKSGVYYRPRGASKSISLKESYYVEIDEKGKESRQIQFNTDMEYEEFRRLAAYLDHFKTAIKKYSTEIQYRVDTVMLNGKFVSSLETDSEGFRIIDSGPGPVPRMLQIKMKFTPYPRPDDNFEIFINKDLVYLLKEGREGFYEANIILPSFPEFNMKVHYVNPTGKKEKIFDCSFSLLSKARKMADIRDFLSQLSNAFSRRDTIYLFDRISPDYRDGFGNTYQDMVRSLEEGLRNWRDVRVDFHPHTFEFKDDIARVNMNYRVTALGENWDWRYDELGSDLMTLHYQNGKWQIKAKEKGLFFQTIKVSIDLRLGILKGRVTDEASGHPLSGAIVRLINKPYHTTTDIMGDYVFYNLPVGRYNVEITKNGYGKISISNIDVYATGRKY
ncbi:MAG: carboxypeptidase regulatory-like domain-containing protein [Candidatus Riflebacteria bacterium]|nr:carboxypeptidase regulatory-like domain-containing protein [Candidatus Riflebacteria bacterium]